MSWRKPVQNWTTKVEQLVGNNFVNNIVVLCWIKWLKAVNVWYLYELSEIAAPFRFLAEIGFSIAKMCQYDPNVLKSALLT